MANPVKRTSRTKKGMRRSHHALKPQQIMHCKKCGNSVLPHHACQMCGTYKGKQVIAVE